MLKALDRNVAAAEEQLLFLAPSMTVVSDVFQNVDINPERHDGLLHEVQRLRGSIYLKDGALDPSLLTSDGRHVSPDDERSWHMLLLDRQGGIVASSCYMEHDADVTFEGTRAMHCPLAKDDTWRGRLWRTIESELAAARSERMKYVELGGWAVSERCRGTAGPISLALAVWAFSRRGGGALGLTTATFRHCSSTILKRLGGSRFEIDGETLPPYYDDRYSCMMELLRFDSRRPNPKYVPLIDQVREMLPSISVVTRPSAFKVRSASAERLVPFARPESAGVVALAS